MYKLLLSSLMAAAVLTSSPAHAARGLSPDRVFKKASPSVVQIHVPIQKDKYITGSGVVVSYPKIGKVVLTNCHVVDVVMSSPIRVLTAGGETVAADVYARNSQLDMCLLRPAQGASIRAAPAKTSALKNVQIGDRVYAIGSPQGLDLTLSDGLISGFRVFDGIRMIQTTAAISKGSSGGGLFDDRGNLIGITTMYLANSQALNFAVPVEMANQAVVVENIPAPHKSAVNDMSAIGAGYLWKNSAQHSKSLALDKPR